jgi:hypothetical protein
VDNLIDELENNIYKRWLRKFDYSTQSLLDCCEFLIWHHVGNHTGITLRTSRETVARALIEERELLIGKAKPLFGRDVEIKVILWSEELMHMRTRQVDILPVAGEGFLTVVPKEREQRVSA